MAHLATLGGPGTFAGQGTAALRDRDPRYADAPVTYFETIDDVWAALFEGSADEVVLGADTQRTGMAPDVIRWLAEREPPLHVNAEVVVPYGCLLLAKPGTELGHITRVLGHGSIQQCGAFLDANLPDASREIHRGNSMEAAKEVVAGDGTLAVVASRTTLELVPGLVVLRDGIDGNAAAAWWAIGATPRFATTADVAVLSGTLGAGAGAVLADLTDGGWSLRSVHSMPTGRRLFEQSAVVVLTGDGLRPPTIDPASGLRLTGAFPAV
jgi:prephenate dehydratase